MALADDVQALRDRTLGELKAAHDFFSDTKVAWAIVRESVRAGNKFTIKTTPEVAIALEPPEDSANSMVLHSNETGTVTTEAQLVGRAREYTKRQLPEATFQQFISTGEAFLVDFMRSWLLAYPGNLGKKQVDFAKVLELPDKGAIIRLVVDNELNEVAYRSPADWFKYMNDKTGVGVPTEDEINRFAEAKASRDILVHNRGVANKIGERIDIPGDYHREIWELICKMVVDISDAAIAKAT
jgi:hypothetical protein